MLVAARAFNASEVDILLTVGPPRTDGAEGRPSLPLPRRRDGERAAVQTRGKQGGGIPPTRAVPRAYPP